MIRFILSVTLMMSVLFSFASGAFAENNAAINISERPVKVEITELIIDEYKGVATSAKAIVKDGETVLENGVDYKIVSEEEEYAFDPIIYKDDNKIRFSYCIYGIGKYKGRFPEEDYLLYETTAPVKGKAGDKAYWKYDEKNDFIYFGGKGSVISGRASDAKYVYFDGVSSIAGNYGYINEDEMHGCIDADEVTVTGSVKTIDRLYVDAKRVNIQYGVKKIDGYALTAKIGSNQLYVPRTVKKLGKQSVGYVYTYTGGEGDSDYFKVKGFTIVGEKGTAAQKYAKKNKIKFVELKQSSVKKLTAGKKRFTVNLEKASNASGYELQYSTAKYFQSGRKTVKLKKAKNTKKTVKKLKKGTKYYVRVRTYKTVKGKKYYSCWSKIKAVKAK